MKKTNNNEALYSLAMVEIEQYIKVVSDVDQVLNEPIKLMNQIFKCEASDELIQCLGDLTIKPLGKVKRGLNAVNKKIAKYEKSLSSYLLANADKQIEFNKAIGDLRSLINQKQVFIKDNLDRCFNYIQNHNKSVNV